MSSDTNSPHSGVRRVICARILLPKWFVTLLLTIPAVIAIIFADISFGDVQPLSVATGAAIALLIGIVLSLADVLLKSPADLVLKPGISRYGKACDFAIWYLLFLVFLMVGLMIVLLVS